MEYASKTKRTKRSLALQLPFPLVCIYAHKKPVATDRKGGKDDQILEPFVGEKVNSFLTRRFSLQTFQNSLDTQKTELT
jgi:hypothetical protein